MDAACSAASAPFTKTVCSIRIRSDTRGCGDFAADSTHCLAISRGDQGCWCKDFFFKIPKKVTKKNDGVAKIYAFCHFASMLQFQIFWVLTRHNLTWLSVPVTPTQQILQHRKPVTPLQNLIALQPRVTRQARELIGPSWISKCMFFLTFARQPLESQRPDYPIVLPCSLRGSLILSHPWNVWPTFASLRAAPGW